MYKTFIKLLKCNIKMNSIEQVRNKFEEIRQHLLRFTGGDVRLTKDETTGIATICLDRADKKNALSGHMMVQFRDHVAELETWSVGKAVILYGEGNFCSGGDLNLAKATSTAREGLYMSEWMQDTLKRLQELPLFSVCVLTGPALGGGAEVSVFCDYIVAADNVKFGFVHGKMGIITAFGGGTRLARRIGYRKALDLLLTSKILTADELVSIGLAECVVPTKEALTKATEWLSKRLQHHYTVTRAMKETMYKASVLSCDESLLYEKNRFGPFWGGELNREALARNIKHVPK